MWVVFEGGLSEVAFTHLVLLLGLRPVLEGAEELIPHDQALGKVAVRLQVVQRVVTPAELHAQRLGDEPERVALWSPRKLGVA